MAELIFHPEAKIEIREAAEYYENCQISLGKTYLLAVESAIQRLSFYPTAWRKIRDPFRRILVKKFPYGIIYSVDQDEIFIAAVMHLRRKPDYWYKRI